LPETRWAWYTVRTLFTIRSASRTPRRVM